MIASIHDLVYVTCVETEPGDRQNFLEKVRPTLTSRTLPEGRLTTDHIIQVPSKCAFCFCNFNTDFVGHPLGGFPCMEVQMVDSEFQKCYYFEAKYTVLYAGLP